MPLPATIRARRDRTPMPIRAPRRGRQRPDAPPRARMRHVLPPRPAGVLAVLANAGDADVVWVGHTGTDHLLSVADLWAALPMDTEILMRWWHESSSLVPPEPEAQIAWLYEWWKRIDDWIVVNRLTR